MIEVTHTKIPGVMLVAPRLYRDARGAFAEFWRARAYAEAGIPDDFVQDNVSWSTRGVLRGLHYQEPDPQAKLVTVLFGTIFDVAADLRPASPTFLDHVGYELSAEQPRQIYIPAGCAHGFVVTSEHAIVSYKCGAYYSPAGDRAIRWNDPALAIDWPVRDPILSEKDAAAPFVADVFASRRA